MIDVNGKTIPEMFLAQVQRLGDKACVAYKKDGVYVDISWNEMGRMIRDLASYLISIGIGKDDKAAIFSPNRYEWVIADQGTLAIGSVNVPIYATNSAEEARYVLQHSESKICFVATEDHLNKVLEVKKNLPKLSTIIIFDNYTKGAQGVITFQEALKKGSEYSDKKKLDSMMRSVKLEDLATLIYTSGTTGDPKGVMLTHGNFMSDVLGTYASLVNLLREDMEVLLSFLPLSHAFERTCGYYIPVYLGSKIAFAEDFAKIQQNLLEVRPSVVISVPRLFEKIHAGVLSKVAEAPAVRKMIFNWAMKMAGKNVDYVSNDKKPSGLLAKKIGLADKLVFSKLKEALGLDKITYFSSGGGPLSVSDCEFFVGMGFFVGEGYGLTETSPVITTSRRGMHKSGTVGPALDNTEIKISDEGEILVKGPVVMKGYYKNPEATKEAFTEDGFFKTGDIGRFDEKNRLVITGRIKDIIITAGGKNISPQNIENSLKNSPYIEQVAIIGDKRKYLSALVIPAFEELKKWAQKQGISFSNNNDLIQNKQVVDLIGSEINKYMKQFSNVEQIRKFKLMDAEWTQETEELTPTLKVKRRVIEKKYASEIESLYIDADK